MATTKSGFIKFTTGGVVTLAAVGNGTAASAATNLGGSRLDDVTVRLDKAAYAKNGGVRVALTGTTVKTIDLTATSTGAQAYAGDTAFATWSQMILYNDSGFDVTVASGASNGATGVPTVVLKTGDYLVVKKAAAVTVDGTHKTIDVTPVTGGSFVLLVGGA